MAKSENLTLRRFLEDLGADSDLVRDTAVARLRLLGPVSAAPVARVACSPDARPAARVAALQVLETLGGSRALAAGKTCLVADDGTIVRAAADLLGRLARVEDRCGTTALDALAGLALAEDARTHHRVAAAAALSSLPQRLVRPIIVLLERHPEFEAALTGCQPAESARTLASVLSSDDFACQENLMATVRATSDRTPVTALRRAVDTLRAREARANGRDRGRWTAARASVHEALARRGSRIALYDLRESLEVGPSPLPVGFLGALAQIGDSTCLEGLAAQWAEAGTDVWYRDHLLEVFRAIVRRDGIGRDHPVLKRILTRRPSAALLVAEAPRTARPRR